MNPLQPRPCSRLSPYSQGYRLNCDERFGRKPVQPVEPFDFTQQVFLISAEEPILTNAATFLWGEGMSRIAGFVAHGSQYSPHQLKPHEEAKRIYKLDFATELKGKPIWMDMETDGIQNLDRDIISPVLPHEPARIENELQCLIIK